jgi:hypothetical protein
MFSLVSASVDIAMFLALQQLELAGETNAKA